MARLRGVFGWAAPLLIVAVGAAFMLALGQSRQQMTGPEVVAEPLPPLTLPVHSHAGTLDIEADGIVQPFREVEITAEVNGRIRYKSSDCRVGQFVRRGSILMEIEPIQYALAVRRCETQQSQAELELEESRVAADNVRRLLELSERQLSLEQEERERMGSLSGQNAVSRSDLARIERAVVAAENSRRELQNQLQLLRVKERRLAASVELAAVALEAARLDVDRTRILAPVDGIIARDLVEQDGYARAGQALLVIEDTLRIEVVCRLQMSHLRWLWNRPGASPAGNDSPDREFLENPLAPVDATICCGMAGLRDATCTWNGVLSGYCESGVDRHTRTIACRIALTPPGSRTDAAESSQAGSADPTVLPRLIRGMYVTVLLHARPEGDLLRVPEAAVQPGKIVWRLKNGSAAPLGPLTLVRRVETKDADGTPRRYWIAPAAESGLAAGDRLLLAPPTGDVAGVHVLSSATNRSPTAAG